MENRRYLYLVGTFIFIAITSLIITLLASGFKLSSDGTITQTGIISVNSSPEGALVYINDVPKDATNTNITELKPGTYSVRLEKEGYVSWKQDVEVVKQTVSRVDSLLVPLYPSFSPLTFTGVENPILSPDGQKIVFQSHEPDSAGVWLLDLTDRPFNLTSKPRQLLSDTPEANFSTMVISWSPTSNELQLVKPNITMIKDPVSASYYFSLSSNQILDPTPVGIADQWSQILADEKDAIFSNLSTSELALIESFTNQLWSPDKSRILYSETDGDSISYSIYEIPGTNTSAQPTPTPPSHKKISNPIITLPSSYKVSWFSDSAHFLIMHQNDDSSGVVEIIEVNGHNRTQIFNGSLKKSTAFSSPNGTKIVILSRFNNETASYNLYGINLR